jgi:hypothetical protein
LGIVKKPSLACFLHGKRNALSKPVAIAKSGAARAEHSLVLFGKEMQIAML